MWRKITRGFVVISVLTLGSGVGATSLPPLGEGNGQDLSERDEKLLRAVQRRYLGGVRSREVVQYEGNTVIARDATIHADVIVLRGDIEIQGEIDGSVIAILGDVEVGRHGIVYGDAVSIEGVVHRHRGAIIEGDLIETSMASLRGYLRAEQGRRPGSRRQESRKRGRFHREFWDEDQDVVLLRYNRVEGLFAGLRLPRTYDPRRQLVDFSLYGEAGYGFRSKAWRYQVGAEFSAFSGPPRRTPFLTSFGAEVHDLTDTQDRWIIPETENSLAALLFKRDYMDFYRRSGWSLYLTQRAGGTLQVTARFLSDDFESMANRTNWSLFGGGDFRPNPPVDEGRMQRLRGEIQLDTRDIRGLPDRGWLVHAVAEQAGGQFGGEYEFKRFLVDVRRYQPLAFGDRLLFRLRAGTADGLLPSQFLYDLGGLSTLRGYDFKEFTGDRMILGNIEYWLNAQERLGDAWPFGDLNLVFLFDAGLAWFAVDPSDPLGDFVHLGDRELKTGAGMAVASDDGDFRVELVKRLDVSGRKMVIRFRASRPF